jgi:hypothetical protein
MQYLSGKTPTSFIYASIYKTARQCPRRRRRRGRADVLFLWAADAATMLFAAMPPHYVATPPHYAATPQRRHAATLCRHAAMPRKRVIRAICPILGDNGGCFYNLMYTTGQDVQSQKLAARGASGRGAWQCAMNLGMARGGVAENPRRDPWLCYSSGTPAKQGNGRAKHKPAREVQFR